MSTRLIIMTLVCVGTSLMFVIGRAHADDSKTPPAAKATSVAEASPVQGDGGQNPELDADGKPKPELNNKQIRKLLSAEPDPSLVLEPPPEAPPAPPPAPKAPPRPPASMPPAPTISSNPRAQLGRIPGQLPITPEIAVILVNKEFFPTKIRLKEGVQTRIFFTTTNEKPAAVVVEQLQIQRWVAKEGEQKPPTEEERAKWEAAKEVNRTRVTEIVIEPRRGTYSFHDVLSGAKGTIVVE